MVPLQYGQSGSLGRDLEGGGIERDGGAEPGPPSGPGSPPGIGRISRVGSGSRSGRSSPDLSGPASSRQTPQRPKSALRSRLGVTSTPHSVSIGGREEPSLASAGEQDDPSLPSEAGGPSAARPLQRKPFGRESGSRGQSRVSLRWADDCVPEEGGRPLGEGTEEQRDGNGSDACPGGRVWSSCSRPCCLRSSLPWSGIRMDRRLSGRRLLDSRTLGLQRLSPARCGFPRGFRPGPQHLRTPCQWSGSLPTVAPFPRTAARTAARESPSQSRGFFVSIE